MTPIVGHVHAAFWTTPPRIGQAWPPHAQDPVTRTSLDVDCPACDGHGRVRPVWTLCARCDGLGYVYRPGAPAFGALMTLAGRPIGQVVTLATGQVGRVVKHATLGIRPLTYLRLFDPFTDDEAQNRTPFPTACGVSFVSPGDGQTRHAPADRGARTHVDVLDPMRNRP